VFLQSFITYIKAHCVRKLS